MLKLMGLSRVSGLDKLDVIKILAFTTNIQAVGNIHIKLNKTHFYNIKQCINIQYNTYDIPEVNYSALKMNINQSMYKK